jgi:hypothetical protein
MDEFALYDGKQRSRIAIHDKKPFLLLNKHKSNNVKCLLKVIVAPK